MTPLELVCLGIVALYGVPRVRLDPAPGFVVRRLVLIALAAWAGEASCVRLYGFYAYAETWTVVLPGGVPLLVPLIWPVVIHSAHDLALRLLPGEARATALRRAALCAAIVTADAALIEPVAVHAELWTWTEPGLFAVPPVGVLGWGAFALLVGLGLELERRVLPSVQASSFQGGIQEVFAPLAVLLAPLAVHPLLLAMWWGLLRWVNEPVPPKPAVALVWVAAVCLAGWLLKVRPARVRGATLARAPGALFFFGLLVVHRPDPLLAGWVAAFALPYLVLLARRED